MRSLSAYLCACFALLSLHAQAQTIEVPGDHDTLQEALDAAPSGATILVREGPWQSIVIRRPVTLVGDARPTIDGGLTGPPVTLDGPGAGTVTLAGFNVGGGYPDDILPARPPPGITGGGFSELHLIGCTVIAPQRFMFQGLGYGGSAIAVDVPLLVLDGVFALGGGAGIDDNCTSSQPEWIPPPAVVAGRVLMLDSFIEGGSNFTFQYVFWPTEEDCTPGACPFLPGGAGISCDTLYHEGPVEHSVRGGRGARWSACSGGPTCCESPPGSAIASGQTVKIQPGLTPETGAFLGTDYVIRASAPGPRGRLFMASDVNLPVPSRSPRGSLFLDPATLTFAGVVRTPGEIRIPLPLAPELIGRTIAYQLSDPRAGLTRPVVAVVLPPLPPPMPRRALAGNDGPDRVTAGHTHLPTVGNQGSREEGEPDDGRQEHRWPRTRPPLR